MSVPANSDRLTRWFRFYLRGYFRKQFDAVLCSGSPIVDDGEPLLVYTNHPSWWDPIHFLLICSAEFPERRIFGPMDAEALEQYGFFKKIGVFGVDRSAAGARAFVRTGSAILNEPRASLWITGEGAFTDPRKRPVEIMAGVAHLAKRMTRGRIVPLAVEYPFWNERSPLALSRIGEPIVIGEQAVDDWQATLESRLTETMDALAADVATRDASRFRPVLEGRRSVGFFYDAWRRLRAALGGRRFRAGHEERPT